MTTKLVLLTLAGAQLLLAAANVGSRTDSVVSASPLVEQSSLLGGVPAWFETNRGQAPETVHFVGRGFGYDVLFLSGEILFVLSRESGEVDVVRLRFENSTGPKRVVPGNGRNSNTHYFRGRHGVRPLTVPHCDSVRYEEVYPGIDVVFYESKGKLEYDFELSPEARPEEISFRFDADGTSALLPDGSVRIDTPTGALLQRPPLAYQTIGDRRVPVECRYLSGGAESYALSVGSRRRGHSLVIDPVIEYTTLLGGGGIDQIADFAVDPEGNLYVTGHTTSLDFPGMGGVQSTHSRLDDVFVAKLNPSGSDLLYATYIGGESWDHGSGIAVDTGGSAYVTGSSSSLEFPLTLGAVAQCCGVFVLKLAPGGDALSYSTYLGSGKGVDIAVDEAGSVYLAGVSNGGFPATAGAYQDTCCRGKDGFVAKMSADGSTLAFSTMLGGGGSDVPFELALHSDGSAYVAGYTYSADFPTTPGAAQRVLRGVGDMFITRVAASGASLIYSTLYGGSGLDYASSLDVDFDGTALVAGHTDSADFPTLNRAFRYWPPGTAPWGVALKLGASGAVAEVSTYITSRVEPGEMSAALRPDGSFFVAGSTGTAGFAPTPDALQPSLAGLSDAFVFLMDSLGAEVQYASFLGGSGMEHLTGIELGASGDLYLAGKTGSADFPVSNGASQQTYRSAGDGFIARLGQWAGDCVFNLVPPSMVVGPAGGPGSVGVETGPACPWTATTDAGWITISAGSSSSGGGGTIDFAVEANPGAARTGYIYAGGAVAKVEQGGDQSSCVFQLLPASSNFDAKGGSGNVTVSASRPDCQWGATTSETWITITDGSSGTGNGAVAFSVDSSSGLSRTGSIHIQGQAHNVVQRPLDGPEGDFNGDGTTDLVARDTLSNETRVWNLGGALGNETLTTGQFPTQPPPGMAVVAVTDLDRNGTPDLVLQEVATGTVQGWYMGGFQGLEVLSTEWLNPAPIPAWFVVAMTDVDKNGVSDLIWHDVNGRVLVWYLGGDKGNAVLSTGWINRYLFAGWTVVAMPDLDRDGTHDVVWQDSLGRLVAWYLTGDLGNEFRSLEWVHPYAMSGWTVKGAADFDRDGVEDLLWQRDNGQAAVWYMSGDLGNVVRSSAWVSTTANPALSVFCP